MLDSEGPAPSGAEPKANVPAPQGNHWASPLIEVLVALQVNPPAPPARIQQKIDRATQSVTIFRHPANSSLAIAQQEAGNHFQGLRPPDHEAAARYFKLALDSCSDSAGYLSGASNQILQKKVSERIKKIAGALDVAVTFIVQRLRESETKVNTLTADNETLRRTNTDLTTKNTELTTKNTELTTRIPELTTKNTELTTKNTELTTRITGLMGEGQKPLLRLTHGEEQWASFASRLAVLAGVNPADLHPVRSPRRAEIRLARARNPRAPCTRGPD